MTVPIWFGALPVSKMLFWLCGFLAVGTLLASSIYVVRAAETSFDPQSLPAPKRVQVPKLEGTINIDGSLDEPVWKKAAVLTPFYKNDGSGHERERTEVRIWYDDNALYLGWLCKDIDIQATFTNRDSKFWEEEVAEFFVTPRELDRYFELQWNPLGGVFDAIITNHLDQRGVSTNFQGDWSFTAKGMRSAVKLKGTPNNSDDKDEFWQVEVRLPFADLGQPTPKAKEVWRANFYRFNRTKGLPVEQLSWSPTRLEGFHQPTRFGYLEFGNVSK
jgi:Carbohydrate-binding family 9